MPNIGGKDKNETQKGGATASKSDSNESVTSALASATKEIFLAQIGNLQLRLRCAQTKYENAMKKNTVCLPVL